MSTVDQIIGLWPSVSEMSRDIGLKRPSHGTLMKFRGSIPVEYWSRLIEAADRRGIPGVTYEALVRAHTQSLPSVAPPSADAHPISAAE